MRDKNNVEIEDLTTARKICEMLDRIGGNKDPCMVRIAIREGYIPN